MRQARRFDEAAGRDRDASEVEFFVGEERRLVGNVRIFMANCVGRGLTDFRLGHLFFERPHLRLQGVALGLELRGVGTLGAGIGGQIRHQQ